MRVGTALHPRYPRRIGHNRLGAIAVSLHIKKRLAARRHRQSADILRRIHGLDRRIEKMGRRCNPPAPKIQKLELRRRESVGKVDSIIDEFPITMADSIEARDGLSRPARHRPSPYAGECPAFGVVKIAAVLRFVALHSAIFRYLLR